MKRGGSGDAPLDDHDVERVRDLLAAMRGRVDARFRAIAHNPATRARMDGLFDLTMS